MGKTVVVGMADLNVVTDQDIITTIGLGSCVGIALYDELKKVAGLAHVMLPDSKLITNNSNIAKFVDTATLALVDKMIANGAKKFNIKAKLAGGAQMFAINSCSDTMRIGDRNVESAIRVLTSMRIPILAKDVFKDYGRTVILNTQGRFTIKTIDYGIKDI